MAEDLGDRTEAATPKRMQDAREEGRIGKSADAAGALLLLGVTLMLWWGFAPALKGLAVFLADSLGPDSAVDLVDEAGWREWSAAALGFATAYGLPLLVIAWAIGYLAHFWQTGWLFVPSLMKPNLAKINPLAGLRRIFGLSAAMKAGLDAAKVAIVFAVVAVSLAGMLDTILLLPQLDLLPAMASVAGMMLDLALRILAVLLFLGLLDFMYQKWKHQRDLRMTRTDIKEEFKQTEGDPETKKRRMRMQQQIAMQRIGAAVPRADVIVTNPEHISIALEYDEAIMRAPKVLAKGADHLALRIRQIAMKHGIPIVERKALARALYRGVEVGQEVPPSFYQAVAEILAYVYRLNGRVAAGA